MSPAERLPTTRGTGCWRLTASTINSSATWRMSAASSRLLKRCVARPISSSIIASRASGRCAMHWLKCLGCRVDLIFVSAVGEYGELGKIRVAPMDASWDRRLACFDPRGSSNHAHHVRIGRRDRDDAREMVVAQLLKALNTDAQSSISTVVSNSTWQEYAASASGLDSRVSDGLRRPAIHRDRRRLPNPYTRRSRPSP